MGILEGRPLEIVNEGSNHAIVAIPTADGSVQTVIAWGHADERGNVTLNSAEGRSWPEKLRQAQRATVTMMADDSPDEYVSIKTRLIEDTHEGADEHIDQLTMKYIGQETYPFREAGEIRVKFTLAPEQVSHQKQG